MRARAALILILGLLVKGLIAGPVAQAAPVESISITGCTLDQAITAANQGSTTGTNCILSGTGLPYVFMLTGNVSVSAELPPVTSRLIIRADNYGYVIDQTATEAQFLINVGSAGNLTLNTLRLTNTGGNSDGVVVDEGGTLTVVNSTLDNIGAFGILSLGTVAVKHSTISNSSLGLWVLRGSAAVINSTVAGNLIDGIYIDEGASLSISDSTLVNNGGSGLDVDGSVVIDSTIVAENASSDCLARLGQITSHGYNIESPGDTCDFNATGDLVSVPATGTGGLNLDPNLAQNDPRPRPSTRALLSGSVAIDAIPTTSGVCPPNGGSIDERGHARAGQANVGDHRGGLACDVGAYEFDSTETLSAVTLKSVTGKTAAAWPVPVIIGPALAAVVGVWFALRRHDARELRSHHRVAGAQAARRGHCQRQPRQRESE
jgi:hypothetical protein